MQISLDQEQIAEIKTLVSSVVKNGIKQATSARPYLNQIGIAKYFGVSPTTIGYWSKLGMPVAIVDGRKLYGKQSITEWLKAHEMSSQRSKEPNKKPVTMRLVTSKK